MRDGDGLQTTVQRKPLWHFAFAGAAGDMAAVCVTQPFDLVKVRMQLAGEMTNVATPSSPRHVFRLMRKIQRHERVWGSAPSSGLYSGVSASLARQLLWSSTRFGLYAWLIRDWMGHRPDGNGAAMHVKMLCGVVAGAVGATVGTPADVILIRMQADRHWEPQYRRQYHSVFDGWATTVRGDGLTSLWRGCLPTVARATLITSCQLPAYFTFKELLCADQHADVRRALHLDDASPDSTAVHLACSVAAGLVAALVTTPVDVIKTRIMNAQVCRPETPQYNGVTGSFRLILSTEGPRGFLKGFAPTALRLVPHNMILWVVQEKVHTWLDSGVFA